MAYSSPGRRDFLRALGSDCHSLCNGRWLRNRTRLIPGADQFSDWAKAVGLLLPLGLPIAVGFALLFTLERDGAGLVLIVSFAVISIVLAVVFLVRLRRW